MLHFHANLFARPERVDEGPAVVLRGDAQPTLIAPEGLMGTFPVTFEQMEKQLLALPQADCEPDGFFLLSGGAGETFWRLNGHRHEYQSSMHRVELRGSCPAETLDAICQSLGAPPVATVFELVQEGVLLDEASFRAYAERNPLPSAIL